MPWLEEKEQEERNIKLAGKKSSEGKEKSICWVEVKGLSEGDW